MDASGWEAFISVLDGRHCKRAYLEKSVPRDVLVDVLRAAAHAPSTRNGQPWQVAVVSGPRKEALARRLCAEHDRGVPPRPDYDNRLANPDEATRARAREASVGVLHAKGFDRADTAAKRAHLRDNLAFYGAPVEMIFHLPGGATAGQFFELGLFVENVMLGLAACGLGSCPQFSVAGYPDDIRAELGLDADRIVVCGLAVGYPDESMPVNRFRPPRADLADYVRWHHELPPAAADQ
jgi:nitroreductase